MTDKARIRIAAAVTALFLAGLSAAGLALRDHPPQPASAPASASATASPAPTAAAAREQSGDDHQYEAEPAGEAEDDD